jgi:hypothetical protein
VSDFRAYLAEQPVDRQHAIRIAERRYVASLGAFETHPEERAYEESFLGYVEPARGVGSAGY